MNRKWILNQPQLLFFRHQPPGFVGQVSHWTRIQKEVYVGWPASPWHLPISTPKLGLQVHASVSTVFICPGFLGMTDYISPVSQFPALCKELRDLVDPPLKG